MYNMCPLLQMFLSFPEYYGVVTIPGGARSIRVMELNTSSSYLAVRDTQRRYYLNGRWTVDWPGRHPIAGAVFEYKRPYNRPESLISTGPTNETLVIEVKNPWAQNVSFWLMSYIIYIYIAIHACICATWCLLFSWHTFFTSHHYVYIIGLLFVVLCLILSHGSYHVLSPVDIVAGQEPRCTLGIHSKENWWEKEPHQTQLYMGHHTLPMLSDLCHGYV